MKACSASRASNWLSDCPNLFSVLIFTLCFLTFCDETNQEAILTEEGADIYLELSELDMEDACAARSLDRAAQLAGIETNGNKQRQVDEDLDMYNILYWTASELAGHSSYEYGPELQRKLELLLKRGDYMMDKASWDNFTNFVEKTENQLLHDAVPCDYIGSGVCTYDDINLILANNENLTQAQESFDLWNENESGYDWDGLFENMNLVTKASEKNEMSSVREYWESLCEIPGGYEKAYELWSQIKPLYERLHSFIKDRLNVYHGFDVTYNITPSYLLGSLDGLDWSINADFLLPHPYIYRRFFDLFSEKDLGGRSMYQLAQNMTVNLNLGKASKIFWTDSLFDKSCPSKIIDFCQSGNTIVITCKNATWQNFLDAHETFMSVMQKKVSGDEMYHSSYLLRYGSRYSGTIEAVPILGSLLALNTHHLDSLIKVHDEQDKLVILLLHALRTLPKIPYYLAVDTWRLRLLDPDESAEDISEYNVQEKINLWKEIRQEYTLIESYEGEIYRDPYVLENKPYLAKFYGVILAFQLFAELIGEAPEGVDVDKHIAQDTKLNELMRSGLTQEWSDLLMNLFYIYDIESEALTKFYAPLDDYLANYSMSEQVTPPPTTTTETPTTIEIKYLSTNDARNMTTSRPKIERKLDITEEVKDSETNSNSNLPWVFMALIGVVLLLIVVYIAKLKRKHNKRIKRKNNIARKSEKQGNTSV